MNLGIRLRTARKEKGWTQNQLGEASGVKQGTISQIERGDQEKSIFVIPLAIALGVSPEWLENGTEDLTTNDPVDHTEKELTKALAELRPKERESIIALVKSIVASR